MCIKRFRKYGLVLVLVVCSRAVPAQSISQLLSQLAMDTEKLTELRTILQDMYKSYEIIDKGYTDIKSIAQGNFNLHKAFLDGLLVVSPAVRNYPRVVDIINAEYTIVSEYKAAYSRFVADRHFTPTELNTIGTLYSNLFNRSLGCINELTMVLTDGSLRTSDDQRLQAVDRIYADINGQLSLLRQFNNNTSIQAIQRARESNDVEMLRSLYGIQADAN